MTKHVFIHLELLLLLREFKYSFNVRIWNKLISWCQIFIEKFTFEYINNGPGCLSGRKDKDIRNLHCLKEVLFFMAIFSYWMSGRQSCRLPPNDGGISKNLISNFRITVTSFITCFNTNMRPAFRPHSLLWIYYDSYRSSHLFPKSLQLNGVCKAK